MHQGHLLMIKKLTLRVDRLIIGLGSTNVQPNCENPFSAEERKEMLRRGMKEAGVRNYEILELPDFESDEEWVKTVRKLVGEFDTAWSGDAWVLRLFKENHLPIETIQEFPGYSATKIRRRMVQGLPWLKYVPLSIRKYLKDAGAVKRVRELCKK